ncbi:MAG: hypothetical protein J6S69_05805 [Proteobacteria bacterium]|nr:hypothetical protein [Pseudomonadota bacterium]
MSKGLQTTIPKSWFYKPVHAIWQNNIPTLKLSLTTTNLPFVLIHQKTRDILIHNIVGWNTPITWIYRPLTSKLYNNQYFWFGPGDIIKHMKPNMHMPVMLWFF